MPQCALIPVGQRSHACAGDGRFGRRGLVGRRFVRISPRTVVATAGISQRSGERLWAGNRISTTSVLGPAELGDDPPRKLKRERQWPTRTSYSVAYIPESELRAWGIVRWTISSGRRPRG